MYGFINLSRLGEREALLGRHDVANAAPAQIDTLLFQLITQGMHQMVGQ